MGDENDAASGGAPRRVTARATRVEAAASPGNGFTYSVVPAASAGARLSDRRHESRHRTRLRSGKLVRLDGQFLCECLIHNKSMAGCRLRLSKPALDMPPSLFFYDDQSELLFQGRVIWRKEREIGLRLSPCRSSPLYRSIVGAMRRKFYTLSI